MIIRENARLFFLSALSSNAKCEDVLRPSDFDFRLARKSDIKSIRHCNLETLPENYSTDFYDTHIKDWPELALVAEHADRRRNEDQQPQVVGYVLGRIEVNNANANTNTNTALPGWSCRTQKSGRGGAMVIPPPTGHVTSLAVLPGFRRCGAASQLMDMLHERMNYHYKANKVSLHVRKSNRGAIRLYEELLGYKVAGVASSYYSDGEDAFVMEAELPEVDSQPADNIRGASALALPRSLDGTSTTVRSTSGRESAGFVTTAAANSSSSSSGSSGSSKGGLVTAASTSGAGADNHRVYSRNNVGFVTAAAAAAAAAVSSSATAPPPPQPPAAAATAPPTAAAAVPPTAAAAAAPPLVLQAVVSTPRTPGGGDGGGSRNCGLGRRGYGTMSSSRGVQHPCGDSGGGAAATA